MSYRVEGVTPQPLSRDAVIERLANWLGEERRAAIEALVDDGADRFEDGPAAVEEDVYWSFHVGRNHLNVELEFALAAAKVLERLGFDPAEVQFMRSLPCVECEGVTATVRLPALCDVYGSGALT